MSGDRFTLTGVKTHGPAPAGRPVHEKVRVPVKVLLAVTTKEVDAVRPAETGDGVTAAGVSIVKSGGTVTSNEVPTVAVSEFGEDALMVNAYGVLLAGVEPVWIVSVMLFVPPATRVVFGENTHVAVLGNPKHCSVTAPEKPLADVRLKLVVASSPVVARACGGVLSKRPAGMTALSVMACCWVIAAESVPTAVMLKL